MAGPSQARRREEWKAPEILGKRPQGKAQACCRGERFGSSTSATAQVARAPYRVLCCPGNCVSPRPVLGTKDAGGLQHERPKGDTPRDHPMSAGKKRERPRPMDSASPSERGPGTGPGRKGRVWTGDRSLMGIPEGTDSRGQDEQGGGEQGDADPQVFHRLALNAGQVVGAPEGFLSERFRVPAPGTRPVSMSE